jgi:hypothetical protein
MTTTRQLHLRQIRGIGERYDAGRLTHEDAIEQIHRITYDRDELAEAVADLRHNQATRAAELLLIAAGADLRAVERYRIR